MKSLYEILLAKVYSEPLSVGLAASILKVSRKTILNWIYQGIIRGVFKTEGGHYRIWPVYLAEYIKKQDSKIPFKYIDHRTTGVVIADTNIDLLQRLKLKIELALEKADVRITNNIFEAGWLIGSLNPKFIILAVDNFGLNPLEVVKKQSVSKNSNSRTVVAIVGAAKETVLNHSIPKDVFICYRTNSEQMGEEVLNLFLKYNKI